MADTCPKCGRPAVGSDQCPGCGFVISLYDRYLAERGHDPSRKSAAAPAVPAASAPIVWTPVPRREAGGDGSPSWRASESRLLAFHGAGRDLFSIWIVCAFLTLATLGVYYFWAKTRVRHYLYGQTEIEGDRFAYHGTGEELFVGFAKAVVFFIIPIILLSNAPGWFGWGLMATKLGKLGATVLTGLFTPLAIVGARRYRLSRTSWRGIRFSFRGDAKTFVARFVGWSILLFLTAGFYYPVFLVRKQQYLTDHSFFGNARFRFTGEASGLMTAYLRLVGAFAVFFTAFMTVWISALFFGAAALLLPLAAGALVIGVWIKFAAEKRCYFWDHTELEGATLRCSVTPGALARLYLANAVLLLMTLGLATPWVKVRNARFTCETLALDGPIDIDAIAQDAQAAPSTGEGLATFFDTDVGIG